LTKTYLFDIFYYKKLRELTGGIDLANILVMDDEELIRTVMTDLIECLEHSCITAVNGEKAIEIYKEFQSKDKPVDLVILDVFVKNGWGAEKTISELLKINPKVISVVSSGDPEDKLMQKYSQFGFKDTLKKPYKIVDIQSLFSKHNIN